jgi:aryl-alcohol dehydrogenase-like predicted oxidoreductase
MEFRTLGKTGLKVSEIGFGAAQIGNPSLPDSQVESVLNNVLDLGITFIDTAAMYGDSEERIGKFTARRKDEYVLATKCGDYQVMKNGKRETVKDYSPDGILRTIDKSRSKLKMDVIDIVQFHGLPGKEDDWDAAFDALMEAKAKGWTKFVGVSADGTAAAEAAKKWDLDTQEFTYNVLFQEAADVLMPTLHEQQMGSIIKRPIANGVYLMSERPEGTFMGNPWDRAQQMPLGDLAGDMPLIEFALRYTLSHQDVCTAIVGSTNPDHLAANVKVSDGEKLSRELVDKTKQAFSEQFAN